MISYIKGTVSFTEADSIVIDNHSIGYRVRTTIPTVEKVRSGDTVMLYTFLYVREDAMALYGFLSREELRIFQILLGISGIGPKAALSVLSTLSAEDLYYAVLSDDAKSIARSPGIGPKGAKRVIMELKDKLTPENLGIGQTEGVVSPLPVGDAAYSVSDTIEALIALGYSNGDAYRAVHKVPGAEQMDSEELLKKSLTMILTL